MPWRPVCDSDSHATRLSNRSGVRSIRPDRISVSFNGSPVCIDGVGAPGAREVDLSGADIDVTIDLGVGAASAERS